MSGTTTVEDLIEATAQAREVIRQAHEVVKDLRSAIAEARRMQPELMRDWEGKARNVVQELFMDQLPLFVESATKSLVDALGLMATCLKCGQVWGCVEKDSNCPHCGYPIGKRWAHQGYAAPPRNSSVTDITPPVDSSVINVTCR